MRARIAAVVGAAALMLTGCGSDGDGKPRATQAAPPAEPPVATVMPSSPPVTSLPTGPPAKPASRPPGCDEPTVSPQYWWSVCGETGPAPGENAEPAGLMQIGQAATTTGALNPVVGPGGGTLEITPIAVVYHPKSISETPKNGLFLTVGFKQRSISGSPVMTAPLTGGGWQYIAPDGEAFEQGNGNGFNVTPSSFNGGGTPLQPGSFNRAAKTWDISEQQRGGMISYTDGTGVEYRWRLPAQDAGAEVAKLKTDLS